MGIIIGRKREQSILKRLASTERSEFLAVYGRRRVGKTYLIKEAFNNSFTFSHTGLAPVSDSDEESSYDLRDQLQHFFRSLHAYGYKGRKCPDTWLEAFYMLEDLLKEKYTGERMRVFIDELPWMDTPKSKLVRAIDAFWNSWCNGRNVLFIVCGSAASWMLDNVINQKGGLYGRVTFDMKLSPLTLKETEVYLQMLGANMSRYNVAEAYMALGGIPYYLNFWQPDMSVVQNMDYLFFASNAKLKGEFDRLFKSLFSNPKDFVNIVKFLGTRHGGFSRTEIADALGMASGGTLTETLQALEASDFIQLYQPFGNNKRQLAYRLIDPYCWFYLTFLVKGKISDPHYWQNHTLSTSMNAWRGLAFEEICLLHTEQIKHALQIGGIASNDSKWIVPAEGKREGAQVDLIIERADNFVNLCEMKFYQDTFTLDKDEDEKLRHRITCVKEKMKKRQSLHVTLITTYGLTQGKYSSTITHVVTLDDLFS